MMFIERPATKHATSCRKLIHDIGINDAWYMVYMTLNGVQLICPYYRVWINMFERCYSKSALTKRPSYIGCSVAKEWHSFTAFRAWMEKQDWQGKQLDKDILAINNKVYSSKTCVFVTQEINALLTHTKLNNGKYPIGVSFLKDRNKFHASCPVNGKRKHLGRFDTENEASNAYKKAKREDILMHANMQSDDKIRQGLMLHAEAL